MKQDEVIIIGAGGHGQVVVSILNELNYSIGGYFDDSQTKGTIINGVPVLGKISDLSSDKNQKAIIGIGNNKVRKKIAENLNFNWINCIHPFSYIHPSVKIGEGVVVCAGGIIQPNAVIGKHVIINTKASVDHDCIVGDYCHIAVAHLAGGASIEEGVFVALNSTVLPKVNVGAWSIVGAGAIVTKDVGQNKTVVGIPAKEI